MKLRQILADSGQAVGETEIADERKLFITNLNPDPNAALRLLEELRNRQGLGSKRFQRLLWQNAALRMLVRDRVQVTDEAVENMFTLVHGPKRQARLIVTPNLETMADVVKWLQDGASFADIAVNTSTDSSAARGGLLEPMSRVDLNYPAAIRDELFKLKPAEVSTPVLIDNGYALLRLEREIKADDVELSAVRPEMERLVRINQERIAMDQLARQLLTGSTITVIDPVLNESWNRARGQK
jgi:foldase protein PrsA